MTAYLLEQVVRVAIGKKVRNHRSLPNNSSSRDLAVWMIERSRGQQFHDKIHSHFLDTHTAWMFHIAHWA